MERGVFLESAFPGEVQIAMHPAQIPLKTKRQWRGTQGLSALKHHEICCYNTCWYIRTCTNPVANVRLICTAQKAVWANIWPFTCTDRRDPKHTELRAVVSDLRIDKQTPKHVAAIPKDCIRQWQKSTFDSVKHNARNRQRNGAKRLFNVLQQQNIHTKFHTNRLADSEFRDGHV